MRLIRKVFSKNYANLPAVENNSLLLLMYRFAYPFAVVLNKLRISPNQITALSSFFAGFSFVVLISQSGIAWFLFFWGLSILMDFCDGTVARMANKVSKSALRFDHMSDLIKISLIILGTAVRYDDTKFWSLAFVATFGLLYGDLLNHQLTVTKKIQNTVNEASVEKSRLREKFRSIAYIVRFPFLVKLIKNLYSLFFTINGHTLLLFFILPVGRKYSTYLLLYLIILELWTIYTRMLALHRTER